MPISFNPDGSLNVKKKVRRDHIPLLQALNEIPFSVGRKLLIEHLIGKQNAKTARLKLNRFLSFGELSGYDEKELNDLISHLTHKSLITTKKEKGLYPVIVLTEEGSVELISPALECNINNLKKVLEEKTQINNPFTKPTTISDQEKKLFSSLQGFFDHFNDEQKKAVICPKSSILCVAGAGSGKTSVLTKRIEFLVKYKSIDPREILAITFTRKAKEQMKSRLFSLGIDQGVRIETFNSFCEKILQTHGDMYYDSSVRMMSRSEYVKLVLNALKSVGHNQSSIIQSYFTKRQRSTKDEKQLFFSFLYDLQTLQEKIKITDMDATSLKNIIDNSKEHSDLAKTLLSLVSFIDKNMVVLGLRDFADQLLDTLALFEKNPSLLPKFSHILVDEYQDVNDIQIKLIETLNPENIFVVGDPRQSIYGWRGSKISHIIEFPNRYDGCEIIQLTKNYRSNKKILNVCNELVKKTGYHPLQSTNEDEGIANLKYYKSEDEQASGITQEIKKYGQNKSDIFVLARTNKALEKMKIYLQTHNINYLLRTEERKQISATPQKDQVTLATIHAVKGLEAKKVYLINANNVNFPCKASDHPVMELFKLYDENYDAYAEELRVLYVALSRAQSELVVSYTGSLSPFFTTQARNFLENKKTTSSLSKSSTHLPSSTDVVALMMKLRQWRYNKAKERGCPAYIICSDKTLDALSQINPTTTDDLYSVHGLGQAKISEFGEELLLVLKT